VCDVDGENDRAKADGLLEKRDDDAGDRFVGSHDGGELVVREIAGAALDAAEVDALDDDATSADRDEVLVADRIAQLVAERHRVEHVAERLAVGAKRGCGDAEDTNAAEVVEDSAIARGKRVVRLVDDDQPELLGVELLESLASKGLHRGDHDRSESRTPIALLDAGPQPDVAELVSGLLEKLVAMSKHQSAKTKRNNPANEDGEENGLACAGWKNDERSLDATLELCMNRGIGAKLVGAQGRSANSAREITCLVFGCFGPQCGPAASRPQGGFRRLRGPALRIQRLRPAT
jgi:hypothetical protein